MTLFDVPGHAQAANDGVGALADCFVKVFNSGAFDNNEATLSGASVGLLSFPSMGDVTRAYRVRFTGKAKAATGAGSQVDGFLDMIYMQGGRVSLSLLAANTFRPYDSASLQEYARKAFARAEQNAPPGALSSPVPTLTPTPLPAPSPSPTPVPTPAPLAKSAAPIGNSCPADQPVKVTGDKQALPTDHPGYAAAVPASCYLSTDAAGSDGNKLAALPTPVPASPVTASPTQTPPALAPAPVQVAPVRPSGPADATPMCPKGFIDYGGNGKGPSLCKDGFCSHSAGRGTCSGHGGVAIRIGHSDVLLAA